MIKWLFSFFKKPQGPYSVVEMKLDKDHFRQGVQLNSPDKFSGIVATISPKVSLEVEDEQLIIRFDYTIHRNPKNIELIDSELRPLFGAAIADMITKDYNAFGIFDS